MQLLLECWTNIYNNHASKFKKHFITYVKQDKPVIVIYIDRSVSKIYTSSSIIGWKHLMIGKMIVQKVKNVTCDYKKWLVNHWWCSLYDTTARATLRKNLLNGPGTATTKRWSLIGMSSIVVSGMSAVRRSRSCSNSASTSAAASCGAGTGAAGCSLS